MSVDWNSIVGGCALTAMAHPFTYVKVLIQLGHEPLKPELGRNLFFRTQLQYPNIIEYLKHVRRVDGCLGLYRGLIPSLWANSASSLGYMIVSNNLPSDEKDFDMDDDLDDEDIMIVDIVKQTMKETLARCSAVVLSQPFHVISIRCMAQFVGRETTYNTMFGATKEIYTCEGVGGFFSGLAPRIASEVLALWIARFMTHSLNRFVFNESNKLKGMRSACYVYMIYLGQSISYPLSVTSTIMATEGSKLLVTCPPYMFRYDGWVDCLRNVQQRKFSDRGWNLFFRKAHTTLQTASETSVTQTGLVRVVQ